MALTVAGRIAELARLDDLLDDGLDEPRSVLISGAPGIGKTTLLRSATQSARDRGYTVAHCQPSRAESELSYAGLVTLIGELGSQSLGSLPPPQARVLRTVARLEESPEPVDRLSLYLATVALVRTVALRAPLLLAVDDVQWLDQPSGRSLAFLVRRLTGSRVRLLLVRGATAGAAEDLDWSVELARSMPEGRHDGIDLGPVDPGDLSRILRRALGWSPSWPRVMRIAELSQGNPLHAVELTRAFGAVRSAEGLDGPVPDGVLELARSRIAGLPADVRGVLELASVPRLPSVGLLAHLDPAALDLRESLEVAVGQDIVTLDGHGRVRFTHPTLVAAAYASIAPERRRALHRTMALLSDDLEERARHLATASVGPDAQVAVALEGAAEQAWRRGAPDAAADLLREACRLTPAGDGEALALRRIAFGRLLHSAGDVPAASAVLEAVVADLPAGPVRAVALFHLMYVARLAGSLERAVGYGVQAVDEAGGDGLFRAEVLELLSRISDNDIARKLGTAQRALAAVEEVRHPDPEVVFHVRAALVEAEFYAGLGVRLDRLDGLDPGTRTRFPPVRTAARGDDLVGRLLAYEGRIDEGLALLRGMYERASVQNRAVLPAVLGWMADAELSAGRFEAARDLTREAADRAVEIGKDDAPPWEVGLHALALARLGALDEAEETARRVDDPAAPGGAVGLDGAPARLALGVVALARGDAAEAVVQLRALDELKRSSGIREPRVCAHAGDLVESLLAAGDLVGAAEVLGRLDDEGATSGGRSTLAVAARGHAMLLAARGDVAGATAAAERSLELLRELPMPFERGRTLLVLGQVRRRRREKRAARESLHQALEIFEAVRTPDWAARARAELDRVPEHRSDAELTVTEERVARLAAEGLTNQEIAERAFLSPKTVEVNLTRVYRKLGVRRAALAARLAEQSVGNRAKQ
jgi:DNA-binding CsgD family transcriptional regulator